MTAGVYVIENATTGEAYVGTGRDTDRRIAAHLNALKRGASTNPALQSAWSASDGVGFEARVVEVIEGDDEALSVAEKHWIDVYSERAYNIRRTPIRHFATTYLCSTLFRMSGAELKERREALGMSVGELAREFEVLPTTVYRWESETVPLKGLTALGADLVLKRLEQAKRRGDR